MPRPRRERHAAADAPRRRLDNAEPAADATPSSSTDYSVAFSPRQVAVGLAIVAGLVAFARSRRRARPRRKDD